MSRGMCFSYGGFHFIPVRQFEKDEGDFFALSKRLAIDPILGLSADAERQKHPYSHKDFYAATADKTCDIFRCLENGKLYVPGDRELFIYHDPYPGKKTRLEIKDGLKPKPDNYTESAGINETGRWRERNVWYPGRSVRHVPKGITAAQSGAERAEVSRGHSRRNPKG